jgi:transcriptional regulator with XRE-family HTH domain
MYNLVPNMTRQEIKASLKSVGITQESAARAAGVGFEQVNRVLNGHRESRRLLAKLEAMIHGSGRAKEAA